MVEVTQNKQGRFYPKPSVTTIMGKILRNDGLEQWRGRVGNLEADRVSQEGRGLGNEVHSMVEEYLLGGFPSNNAPFSMNPVAIKLFFQARRWLDENLKDFIAIEKPISGSDYGGTPDIIGRLKDNSTAIIDLKTSKQMDRNMGIQLAALENLHGEVDKLIILRVKKKEKELASPDTKAQIKDFKKDKEFKNFLPAFMGMKQTYYALYHKDIPKEG